MSPKRPRKPKHPRELDDEIARSLSKSKSKPVAKRQKKSTDVQAEQHKKSTDIQDERQKKSADVEAELAVLRGAYLI